MFEEEDALLRISAQTDAEDFVRNVLQGIIEVFGARAASYSDAIGGRTWRLRPGADLVEDVPLIETDYGVTRIGYGSDLDAPYADGREGYALVPIERLGERYGWLYAYGIDLALVQRLERFTRFVALVAENLRLYEAAKSAAETDIIAGIANRRALESTVASFIQVKKPFAYVMFDINDFKSLNDSKGHAAGDEALRLIGTTLTQHKRKGDFVARYGGDELVALLEGGRDHQTFIQRVQESLNHHGLSISAGVARYPEEAETLLDLYNLADDRMYVFKEEYKARHSQRTEPQPQPTIAQRFPD